MKEFFIKNKVFIFGLIGSLAIALQPFISGNDVINWGAIGFATLLAGLSYLAKEWRGQSMSILGILGVAAETFAHQLETNTFSWERALLSIGVAVAFTALPDHKSRGYEHSNTIIQAKIEGEQLNPAPLTNENIKKQAKT